MRLTYLLAATMLFVGCCGTASQDLNLMKAEDFQHPVTGEEMDFQSELAPDMLALIEKWRKRAVSG